MNSSNLIEREVVQRAQPGDQPASREIIDKLHQPLLGFIYRLLGPTHRSQMEDIGGEVGTRIDEALLSINPEQREVFEMRERGGMEYREIAERMGVAEGTVKSRLHRARIALRELLADMNPAFEPAPA